MKFSLLLKKNISMSEKQRRFQFSPKLFPHNFIFASPRKTIRYDMQHFYWSCKFISSDLVSATQQLRLVTIRPNKINKLALVYVRVSIHTYHISVYCSVKHTPCNSDHYDNSEIQFYAVSCSRKHLPPPPPLPPPSHKHT